MHSGTGMTTEPEMMTARRAAARRADRRAAGWAHVHPARTKVRSPTCPRARRPGSAPAAFRWARARRSLRPRAARDIDRARLLPWQAREDRPAAPWYTRVHRVRLLEMLFSCLGLLRSVTTHREGEEGKRLAPAAQRLACALAPQGARQRPEPTLAPPAARATPRSRKSSLSRRPYLAPPPAALRAA